VPKYLRAAVIPPKAEARFERGGAIFLMSIGT
jgi:hypothetical protein